jgi:hypothetical protein
MLIPATVNSKGFRTEFKTRPRMSTLLRISLANIEIAYNEADFTSVSVSVRWRRFS